MGRTFHRIRAVAAAVTVGSAALFALGATGPGTAVAAGDAPAGQSQPAPPVAGHQVASALPGVVPTSNCLARLHIRCYTPLQYRTAYNLNPLYKAGITGKGRTIVVVDVFGSPTIQRDLNVFDARFGLPNTTISVRKWGKVPAFSARNAGMVEWAAETTLDVEYAHAMAPGAKIVLLETASWPDVTSGFSQVMTAEKSVIDQGVGDVISQSLGVAEQAFPDFEVPGTPSLQALRYAFTDAARKRVTVLAASGDAGVSDPTVSGLLYQERTVFWPSSDPLVTAVGGTRLTLNDSGSRLAADVVWNDGRRGGAAGGGVSGVFARPGFQSGLASVIGSHRGTPDISMTAASSAAAWIYGSYDSADKGWALVGGTSEATPIFAGVVALADQKAGHRLGWINARLYQLALHSPAAHGIVDVTSGNNAFNGLAGYSARRGYDLASGLGTINGTLFVNALARS